MNDCERLDYATNATQHYFHWIGTFEFSCVGSLRFVGLTSPKKRPVGLSSSKKRSESSLALVASLKDNRSDNDTINDDDDKNDNNKFTGGLRGAHNMLFFPGIPDKKDRQHDRTRHHVKTNTQDKHKQPQGN